jgi:hypothetical protein
MVIWVLYLAEDPGLVVGDGVVFDGVVGQFLLEAVDHLDGPELEDHAAAGAALGRIWTTGMSVTWSVWRVTCTWWYWVRGVVLW